MKNVNHCSQIDNRPGVDSPKTPSHTSPETLPFGPPMPSRFQRFASTVVFDGTYDTTITADGLCDPRSGVVEHFRKTEVCPEIETRLALVDVDARHLASDLADDFALELVRRTGKPHRVTIRVAVDVIVEEVRCG